jgi:hypothetical protein
VPAPSLFGPIGGTGLLAAMLRREDELRSPVKAAASIRDSARTASRRSLVDIEGYGQAPLS